MALISCPECGKLISDRAPHCIHCGCPISTSSEHDNIDKAVNTHKETFTSQKHTAYINGASNKKPFLIIGSLFLATALIIVFVVMRATNSNGTANKASDSPKTYSSSSTRKSVSNSNYSLYSENEGESWKSALVITDINYGQEGSYIVCKGSVQNNGKKTYKYVKVRELLGTELEKRLILIGLMQLAQKGFDRGKNLLSECLSMHFQIL